MKQEEVRRQWTDKTDSMPAGFSVRDANSADAQGLT